MDNKYNNNVDFGYSWLWTYGHLSIAGLVLGVLIVAALLGAPLWVLAPLLAVEILAFAGFIVARFVFRVNDPAEMPTAEFLKDGTGRVLDLGCGSGRTSIMVALARPEAEVVALDNFSASYIADHGKANTARNFEIAGIAGRVEVNEGDMRRLPFADGTFDGAVSAAALDHLGKDIPIALAEAHRVLRPGGELLLMVLVPNVWQAIVFGGHHMSFPRRRVWRGMLSSAGFTPVSEGSARGLAWFHVRKSAAELPRGEALSTESRAQQAKKEEVVSRHGSSLRKTLIPIALTGLAFFLVSLLLRMSGLDVSWWWVAAAVPVGIHGGAILLLLAGLVRWLSRSRTRANARAGGLGHSGQRTDPPEL